jgi:hypothetical protein
MSTLVCEPVSFAWHSCFPPRFAADSEPMSDIEGRFQHMSDNDTSSPSPANGAAVASDSAIKGSQRHAQTRSSCQPRIQVGENGLDPGWTISDG